MTISVGELFDKCGLRFDGVARWDEKVPLNEPGIYAIASTSDLNDSIGLMTSYRPSQQAFDLLKATCPSVTIDGRSATTDELADRIGDFWIPQSAILYIGLAGTSVQTRVDQFYRTRIGQRAPHSGGWWLKTLSGLEDLYVHYAAANDPAAMESLMLRTFAAAVPPSIRRALHDHDHVAPFANVKVAGGNKRHGLGGYKIILRKAGQNELAAEARHVVTPSIAEIRPIANLRKSGPETTDHRALIESQVITQKDRANSNLRIPARSKFALPANDGFLDVTFRGQTQKVRWRVNGSRSGTIGLGKTIMRSIGNTNESIWLRVDGTSVLVEETTAG
ncbi:hypothetical protein [Arthrobacter sp. CJ23]|uniref:hypothetical protein n=1 Tax=Arthrobacter sp. CJ23 TaxID=2972479 RepID=UPI00215C3ADC|nr:hypothetical protein [Arthrobacter sp. CJ23]UVJ40562.1 hypothetical protein NVV90_05145 [Arthrobacter sp. CJ23]